MNLHVGTSGYSYKEWKGSFYPPKMKADEMLGYYAERFDSVEINGTFYRLPTAETVKSWASQVPAKFKFALKAPQRITHFQRLKNADESVAEFFKLVAVLDKKAGPILFGLPPNMKKDADRLREFLSILPKKVRVAFEFRHESWSDDEVFGLLRKRNVALCVAEAETKDDLKVPTISTADWGYVRLRLLDYSDADLKKWLKWIRAQNWTDAFVYFKHEDDAKGPAFAKRMIELT